MLRPIETITDLVVYARKHGAVGRDTLIASGLGSMGAVVAELRRRGYTVHTETAPARIVIDAPPSVGAKQRKKDQIPLFDMEPTRARPRGFGDSDREE